MARSKTGLDPHWQTFVDREVEQGHFGSPSEVIEEGLRMLERMTAKRESLRAHLAQGIAQADRGEFAETFDVQSILQQAKDEQ